VDVSLPGVDVDMTTIVMDDEQRVIPERWLIEWVEFGLTDMRAYLRRHAEFDQWCRERDGAGNTNQKEQ